MPSVALKEWAAICGALAAGRQTILLRKGGIAEDAGVFRPDHPRFWLLPTYFHEQRTSLTTEGVNYLEAAEAERPPAGMLRLTHYADVREVKYLTSLDEVLAHASRHLWSSDTVRQRFAYRTPGLYVMEVHVHRANEPLTIADRPEYAGCKSWVMLDDIPFMYIS